MELCSVNVWWVLKFLLQSPSSTVPDQSCSIPNSSQHKSIFMETEIRIFILTYQNLNSLFHEVISIHLFLTTLYNCLMHITMHVTWFRTPFHKALIGKLRICLLESHKFLSRKMSGLQMLLQDVFHQRKKKEQRHLWLPTLTPKSIMWEFYRTVLVVETRSQ